MPALRFPRLSLGFERVRPYLTGAALIVALAILIQATNAHQRIGHWLFWPYALLWLIVLFWIFACVSIGHTVVGLIPKLLLPIRERLLFDFAMGTLVFCVGLFLAGLLGLLRGPFFYVFPLLLAVLGTPRLIQDIPRVLRHYRGARRRARWRPSPLERAALTLGVLGIAIAYLPILMPENACFDSRNYHLGIAESYAAAGSIGRFPEGWTAGTLPHLASWLYTWPFTVGPFKLFMRIELAAHLEFVLFLATLAAVPLLVEAICPGRRAALSWVVFFLFPCIFVYDSSLGIAADHVLAFWAIPIALAARRVARSWEVGPSILLGLMVAGATLTKYQALSLVAPIALWLVVECIRQGRASILRRFLVGPGVAAAAALVGTAPHWLANLVWHGDPLYPMLHGIFPSHPWVAGWKGPDFDKGWQPEGPLASRLLETATAVFTFSFVPHDWYAFHRNVPVFGFLFTLSLLVLPFLRGTRRIWPLAAGTCLGVFIWYWTYHQDRYLQALLPWMVATTAAVLTLAWSLHGWIIRVGIAALVGLQLIWGGDSPFIASHAMMHDPPLKRAIDLLSTTYRGEWESRFRTGTGYERLEAHLPPKAVVLLHEEYLRLGLGRPSVNDSLRWQGGIDYRVLGQADRVFELLRSYGVTHIVWSRSHSVNREIPVSGELVFFDFVYRHGVSRHDLDDFGVIELPRMRPSARSLGAVAYLGCKVRRTVPLGEIDELLSGDDADQRSSDASATPPLAELIEKADFVVMHDRCQDGAADTVQRSFAAAPRWGDLSLWVRK